MDLIGVNLNDYQEPEILPDGTETEFRVLDAELKSNGEYEWIQVVLQPITDVVTNPAVIYHSLFLPNENDDKKRRNTALYYIKKFCDSIDYTPEDGIPRTEDMLGRTGRAVVKEQKDEGYEKKNGVRRFVKEPQALRDSFVRNGD